MVEKINMETEEMTLIREKKAKWWNLYLWLSRIQTQNVLRISHKKYFAILLGYFSCFHLFHFHEPLVCLSSLNSSLHHCIFLINLHLFLVPFTLLFFVVVAARAFFVRGSGIEKKRGISVKGHSHMNKKETFWIKDASLLVVGAMLFRKYIFIAPE